MNIIDQILSEKEFKGNPPVLIDIGASGEIHQKWKPIAPYSICIAFDADKREMGYITNETAGFRKLIIYNCIVTDKDENESEFFLTQSPFCSSLLQPDNDALKVWSFADKFNVQSKVKLKSRSLSSVLAEQNLNYVDWFKTDSQGTDLRLFLNIPEEISKNILAAEFEPGIIDAYNGEDKMHMVLSTMEKMDFWLSDITIKGSHRISGSMLEELSSNPKMKKLLSFSLKESPGWGEMIYLNTMNRVNTRRELLLGWVFAIINKQYGFALEIAVKGLQVYQEDIFSEIKKESISRIKKELFSVKFWPAVKKKLFE